jgi:hypothetical protein
MPPRGSFAIPRYTHSNCAGARRAYERAFGHPWPHTDDDLRELAREIPPQYELQHANCNETQWLIIAMREDDPTPAPAAL